jgi:hypothetical protein
MSYISKLYEDFLDARDDVPDKYNALFFVGFLPSHLDYLAKELKQIVSNLLREVKVLDARGKSLIQMSSEVTGLTVRTNYDAENSIRDHLANTDMALIIREISAANFTKHRRGEAGAQAQGLIKALDSLREASGRLRGDLIFVDYASFLEKSWDDLGVYIEFNVPPLSIRDGARDLIELINEEQTIPTIG